MKKTFLNSKTKMMMRKKTLKEQSTEYPQQISDFAEPIRKPISLDQVVDRYVVRYEKESIPLEGQPNDQMENDNQNNLMEKALKRKSLKRIFFEQAAPPEENLTPDDETAAPESEFDAGLPNTGDEGFGDDSGTTKAQQTPIMNTPKINLEDFSRSIARLLNNFEALLNPKTLILNRVEAYIKTNYNEKTAKHFIEIMEQNYGIHSTSVSNDVEKNEFPTPYGVGAVSDGGTGGT